jgi:hypothetical protein
MKKYIILLCCFIPTIAAAENITTPVPSPLVESLTLRLLPQYTPCEYNGARYACYSLEQQKTLMELEASAKTCTSQMTAANTALQLRADSLQLLAKQIELVLANELASKKFIEEQAKSLDKAIKEKNDWRAEAETPVIWPYVIGGVIGVLGLGFGVGASLFN